MSDMNASPDANTSRPVSREVKTQTGFLGIDSLYLVLEYPHRDVFDMWATAVADIHDSRLYNGIPYDEFLIRRGGLGYKLSVWDGDARLFITDRVEDVLSGSAATGQGMGVMLQLGPKWLQRYGNVVFTDRLIENVLAQFMVFGVSKPADYPIRINRLDIALDVVGLAVEEFSIDEWRKQWVGYAHQKAFHDDVSGKLEGFSVGSSKGMVRFKVYDKIRESVMRKSFGFWSSVWGFGESDVQPVARFEWSIKCYEAKFSGLRYLSDLTLNGFMDLLNYASLVWGRLCIPQDDDRNKARWPLAPLWQDIRRLIEEWTLDHDGVAKREYDYRPDLNPSYLKSVSGWIGGLMARAGIERKLDTPASLGAALSLIEAEGISIADKAVDKFDVFSKLIGSDREKDA